MACNVDDCPTMWARRTVSLGIGVLVAALAACDGGGPALQAGAGPGASAWKDDGSVACTKDTECAAGETCANSICQMKRCGEPNYKSLPPLGNAGYFKRDREIVVAETLAGPSGSLLGYEPQNGAFAKMGASWMVTSGRVIDVAGGNFAGTRPEGIATINEGSQIVTVKLKSGDIAIPVGFVPVAVTAGDVDGDGIDEVIALSDTGTVAACKATTKTCTTVNVAVPVRATDIAAGDMDGDGFAEAVVLAGTSFGVVNFDSEKTGNKKTAIVTVPVTLTRIAMADLDGDGHDDIIGLEDSLGQEELHLLEVSEDAAVIRTTALVPSGARDVTVGPTGADQTMIAVLGSDNTVQMLSLEQATLTLQYTSPIAGAASASRIALADLDGDSPMRALRGAPKLVPGSVVPIAVLTLPPYSRSNSEGVSSAAVGATESQEKTNVKTVILSAQLGIAFGGELGPIVTAEVNATIRRENWTIESASKGFSVGGSFEIEAHPEKDGFSSGAVMLGCACYHQYQYVVEDPRHILGPDTDGKTMDVFVPVGGQTSVWSTRRYNALATALGTLPKIDVPHQMGQVASYPDKPRTLDGLPIPEEDLVFKKSPTFRTSDVASVNFELTVSEGSAREQHVYDSLAIGAEVGAFGVTLSGEVGVNVGKGYQVSVGKEASFSGKVPTVRNDPETPEDEYGLYGYSFTPIVYRHRYMDDKRQPSAFYVLTYAVGK